MAKLLVMHEDDPGIAIILTERVNGVEGWAGKCTECGHVIHRWRRDGAVDSARKHIEQHESGL